MRIKKKGTAGAAAIYISRTKALKKLQLSLRDFRRLCILKGIYPHEPLHKKTVNKGSTANKVWYYVRDINFLAQEPIINKFREYKVFLRKLNHYKAKKEESKLKKLYENKPEYSLDRIVKERYPTFGSALRDLDDALCMAFLFATFPYTKVLKLDIIAECKRLSAEFMHYVIESNSLTNTFVSIKGIYFQAIICGEKVTWVIPHERGLGHISDVDFSVMATFAEFYVSMLGFVNFRLYQLLGLFYPPRIQTGQNIVELTNDDGINEEVVEKVYSLCRPLARRPDVEARGDELDTFDDDEGLAERVKEAKQIRLLFKNCVFFINRECPKEALATVIRNCGGQVTWDNAPVSLSADHPSITHHIVDRPTSKFNVNRTYVQPQWVFDSFNARRKLPVQQYLPGQTLPPHFSPFVKEKPGDYIPIERIEELRSLGEDVSGLANPNHIEGEPKPKKAKKVVEENKGMQAKVGRMSKKNKQKEINLKGEQLKMREMMLAKKHIRVYNKIKKGVRRNRAEGSALAKKRKLIDSQKAAKAMIGES